MQLHPKTGTVGYSAHSSPPFYHSYRRWASVAVVLACASPALGTTSTWISPVSSTWLTPTNWSTNPNVPNAIDDSATLGTSTANETVTLNAPVILGNLTFDSPFGYTLAPGTGNLTLQTSAGNASLTITSALNNANDQISARINFASPSTITNNATLGNLTFSAPLSGSSDITFNGSSPILLAGNNSLWTSNLFINAANVTAFSSTALGTGNATINAGAALNLANTTTKTFTLNGGTLHSTTATAITLNNTTLSADSSISGTNFTVNTLIGAANLSLTTTNLTLSGNSPTFTGSIAIAPGSFVQLTGGFANATQFSLGAGSTLIVTRPAGTDSTLNSLAPGTLLTNGGTLGIAADIDFRPLLAPTSTLAGILINTSNATLGGSNSLDLNAFSNPTTLRIAGNGSLASTLDIRPDLATHTFRFGLANITSNLTINATLADHDSASANLDINGGTTILAAANTYTGITTVANGTLQINNANALGSASGTDSDATIINANGVLKLGAGLTLNNEKIIVNANANITANNSTAIYANPIVMNGGTLGVATYTGSLSGGDFGIVSGTLAGTSSYTGNASVIGSAILAGVNALSPSGNTVIAGGTLTLASGLTFSSVPITVNTGTLAGTDTSSNFANTLVMNGGGVANATFSGQITGPGNFTISGAILAGTGSYTGNATFTASSTISSPTALSSLGQTIVSAGTVTVAAGITAPIQIIGGTLNLNTSASSPITVNGGTLNANASQSGSITINAGTANLNANSAGNIFLNGSPAAPFSFAVTGGTLNLNTAGSEFITQNGGLIFLRDTAHSQTGTISTANGTIIENGAGTVTVSSNIQSSGVINVGTDPFNAGVFNLTGGISGSGIATFSPAGGSQQTAGTINVGPLNYTGVVIVNHGNSNQFANFASANMIGAMFLKGQSNFSGNVTTVGGVTTSPNGIGGVINVSFSGASNSINGTVYGGFSTSGSVAVNHLIVVGNLGGNGTVSTADQQIELQSGTISFTGTLANITSIVKTTSTTATIDALPSTFVGSVNVQNGQLQLSANLTNNTAPVHLTGSNTSVLVNAATVHNPIFLNNSNGSTFFPSLTFQASSATLDATVDLGSIGSVFGGSSGGTVNASITGGNLTLMPAFGLILTAPTAYTGTTSVSVGAGFTLSGSGAINSHAQISLSSGANLVLDNFSVDVLSRLPDNTPIVMASSNFTFKGSVTAGFTASETTGPVTLAMGANTITSASFNANAATTLTLSSLQRNIGATVDFLPGFQEDLGMSLISSPKIRITGHANSTFLGGGYTINKVDFVKYNTINGIAAMSGTDYFAGPESAWTSSTVVSLASAVTLTADRNVEAVRPDISNSTIAAINLANFTLNLTSGGIIGISMTGSAGSHLTAGGSAATAELFLTSIGGTIPVNITDNPGPDGQYDPIPGGPLDADNGSVSLVFTPGNGSAAATLTGNNTYTGTTYVNSGGLLFASAASFPHGDVVVNAGSLGLTAKFNATIGNLTLHSGIVGDNSHNGTITASAYNVESGTLDISILGSAPLIKSTIGNVSLTSVAGFTGPMTINGGVLLVSFPTATTFSNSVNIQNGTFLLSAGITSVNWRGPLTIGTNGILSLQDGSLDFAPSSVSFAPGATIQNTSTANTLTASGSGDGFTDSTDSTIHANVLNVSTFSITAGNKNIAALTGGGTTTVGANATLTADSIVQTGANGLFVKGLATIRPSGLPSSVSIFGVLSVAGKFDLNNNDAIIRSNSGNLTNVATLIKLGYDNGDWNGSVGITSSTAKASLGTSNVTTLAYMTGAQYAGVTGNVLFDNQFFSPSDLLIKYATLGDANLDGSLSAADLAILSTNWQSISANWTTGDFNNDGIVNNADLALLANNWPGGPTGSSYLAALANFPNIAPEPASLSLLALAAVPALLRRRNKSD